VFFPTKLGGFSPKTAAFSSENPPIFHLAADFPAVLASFSAVSWARRMNFMPRTGKSAKIGHNIAIIGVLGGILGEKIPENDRF
jgi:hypothetical protein